MAVQRSEIGLVSHDATLVDFYRLVFGLRVLEPRELPMGTVHRLGDDEAVIKVMVPTTTPEPAPPAPKQFWDTAGLRYFTLWVDGVAEIADRCAAHGGTVALGPLELRPGVWTMVVHDPDGNVLEVMEDSSTASGAA